MKPISTKFDERIKKNAKHFEEEASNVEAIISQPKELVYKRINSYLEWALEQYQKTTLC